MYCIINMGLSALAAGILAGGSLLGSIVQGKENKRVIKDQREYNDPAAQVQRLRDAGLNPARLFGSMSVDAGNQDDIAVTDYSKIASSVSQAAVSALQMDNLKEQNKNLKAQNQVLNADADSKILDNQLKEAENKEKIARANEAFNFYNEYIELPHPDTDGDWELQDGYWFNNTEHRFANIHDWIDKDMFEKHQRRKQAVRYDYDEKVFNVRIKDLESRLDTIKWAISDTFDADVANASLQLLRSQIQQAQASAELSHQQAHAIQLDNNVFDSLGVGSKGAELILRLIFKILGR